MSGTTLEAKKQRHELGPTFHLVKKGKNCKQHFKFDLTNIVLYFTNGNLARVYPLATTCDKTLMQVESKLHLQMFLLEPGRH